MPITPDDQQQINDFLDYLETVPTSWRPVDFTCGILHCQQPTSPDCPDKMRCESHLGEKFESLQKDFRDTYKEIQRLMEAKR